MAITNDQMFTLFQQAFGTIGQGQNAGTLLLVHVHSKTSANIDVFEDNHNVANSFCHQFIAYFVTDAKSVNGLESYKISNKVMGKR
jgi:hypothetical protein